MSHTPGPWLETITSWAVVEGNYTEIIISSGLPNPNLRKPKLIWKKRIDGPAQPEDIANTHLTTAGPDLLGTLEEILRIVSGNFDLKEGVNLGPIAYASGLQRIAPLARKAIAKAKGENENG